MRTVMLAALAGALAAPAAADTTIYKLIDDSGHVTYSNQPMKGASTLELEPLTVIPMAPTPRPVAPAAAARTEPRKSEVAIVTPLQPSLAAVESHAQAARAEEEEERRRGLEEDLTAQRHALEHARTALAEERRNPELVAAVRAAQQASNPSPAQLARFRDDIDKASGRIRGLQATVAEHEKNVEALEKALGASKP